jgi:hypothetical protein
MTHGSVRLRPTRFAFLIPYNDKPSLLRAIQINTFLWGGQFNPIIPILIRPPRNLPKYLSKTIVRPEYLRHYLDTFDPDLIVRLGACEDQNFDTNNREVIPLERILSEVEMFRIPQHGIGLFEVLNHFASHEDKYVRRHPIKIVVPKFKGKHSLFLASVFGQLSDELDAIFSKDYLSYFEHEIIGCEINNYPDLLKPQSLFLRRLTAYQIEQKGYSLPCIFFLDANNFIEILDYWNLRALGLNVVPVAKQSASEQCIKDYARAFIDLHFRPAKYPGNYHATIYHGYSSSYKETEEFIESLGVPARAPAQEAKIGFSYLPPIGEWGFENYIRPSIRAPLVKEASFSAADTNKVAVKLVAPDFVAYPGVAGQHRFANEIELHAHHDKELVAEVIPEGSNVLALSWGGFDFHNWRSSTGRMIYLATFADHTIHLNIPLAEDVFFRWFQNSKFKASVSNGGRIAKQMLRSLGGIAGTWLLANEQIFGLVQRLNYRKPRAIDQAEKRADESKAIKYDELWGKIQKIANQSDIWLHRRPDHLLKKLLDSKVLQLGVEVSCTFCNQPSWYSIDEIRYVVKCLNCLQEFSLPVHSPKRELSWSYRTVGAFSPAAQSYGSYAVLLALRFFAVTLHSRTTPMFGLEIKAKDKGEPKEKTPEADLALFFGEGGGRLRNPDLIFVECKTYTNGFQQKDVDTMKLLSNNFPDAYFAFATLEKTLTQKEKRLIKSFVGFLKKGSRTKNTKTKVLVLTGIELYSNRTPPNCWEGKIPTLPAAASNFSFVFQGLMGLCELTQEIHLY